MSRLPIKPNPLAAQYSGTDPAAAQTFAAVGKVIQGLQEDCIVRVVARRAFPGYYDGFELDGPMPVDGSSAPPDPYYGAVLQERSVCVINLTDFGSSGWAVPVPRTMNGRRRQGLSGETVVTVEYWGGGTTAGGDPNGGGVPPGDTGPGSGGGGIPPGLTDIQYSISAVLSWSSVSDFDLYGRDYLNGDVVFYENKPGTNMTLDHDARVDCGGDDPPETISSNSDYTYANTFNFWWNRYQTMCGPTSDAPDSAVVTITNTGSTSIDVLNAKDASVTTIAPSENATFDFLGANAGATGPVEAFDASAFNLTVTSTP